ncbi:MAG: TM0996/MTH895 family glutaredoxin-like protein [Actinobacteria bacterium]|nr:TM0996/MTH895 family glutaredoxin-like protein [Actinomycetota bacterium]
MEILVFGPGCSRCGATEKLIRSVVEEQSVEADVKHVTDLFEMTKYDIVSTPGVVIDGKVVSSGKVPTRDEVKSWICGV